MLLAALLVASSSLLSADPASIIEPFPLAQVKLLDTGLIAARDTNRRYLMSLEPDSLLYAFRQNAGLSTPGEPLQGWEAPTCEVRGHFVGHYLSGCALMYAATGDQGMLERGRLMVQEMAKCQQALGGHYLSAYPESLFDRLESGTNLPWAPYYTLHKIMAGLYDQYTLCANAQALDVLKGMAAWLGKRVEKYDAPALNKVLDKTEEGGIDEALWNLYGVTEDPAHRALAEKFEKRSFLDPLAESRDNLTGRHGNTHIPLVVGAMRRYQLMGEARYLQAAEFFWDRVINARSFASGGTTDAEMWNEPFALAGHLSRTNHETCKTYNLLRLTRQLFCATGNPRYVDYTERAFLNGILGTQEPETGMLEYYVPQIAGYQRVYGTPTSAFWCCTGTGVETWSKLGDSIYYHNADTLFVNLFISSQLSWPQKGLTLTQEASLLNNTQPRLTMQLEAPAEFELCLRIPEWTGPDYEVLLNGKPTAKPAQGSYLRLCREWRDGDMIEMRLSMRLRAVPTPDDPHLVAFMYGPLVLAGITDPSTKDKPAIDPQPVNAQPEAEAQRCAWHFCAYSPDDVSFLKPVDGEPMIFHSVGQPFAMTFKPLAQVVGERYGVYFPVVVPGSDRERMFIQQLEEMRALMAMFTHDPAKETDYVIAGDGESEKAHNLQVGKSVAGMHQGHGWRHAEDWWSWDLKPGEAGDKVLSCVYWGSDVNREFDILVDGEVIATQTLNNDKPNEFFVREYALPKALLQGKDKITVTFRSKIGFAGGVFRCGIKNI